MLNPEFQEQTEHLNYDVILAGVINRLSKEKPPFSDGEPYVKLVKPLWEEGIGGLLPLLVTFRNGIVIRVDFKIV